VLETEVAMTESVLIVEDDFLLAEDHKQTVEELGWTVLGPVATVAGALDQIEVEIPTLALLDMHVSGELVTPVVTALRGRQIPFVIVSGVNDLRKAGGEVFVGARHVMKPFSTEHVQLALRAALSDHTPVRH
jgi:two-component system, response regulator PdtaR